jgi:predicted pyridoxine 5'-phosphate oxidase superfamily flavin-nucleotide-binding protein
LKRGNKRADTLRNLMTCPDVSLAALLPGSREVPHLSGTARVSTDPALLATMALRDKPPHAAIVVHVEHADLTRTTVADFLWNGPLPRASTGPNRDRDRPRRGQHRKRPRRTPARTRPGRHAQRVHPPRHGRVLPLGPPRRGVLIRRHTRADLIDAAVRGRVNVNGRAYERWTWG